MNLQQIQKIITYTSEFFRDALKTRYNCHSHSILMFTRFLARQKCMLIFLYLMQSKYAKAQKQGIPSRRLNLLKFFCEPVHRSFAQSS